MFPMTPAKCSLFLALALSLLLFCACPALAALKYIKSDGFAHGSIAGQVTNGPLSGKWTGGAAEGFTNDDPGQQEVTSDAAHTGSNSWRFSGGYSSAGEATPFSPRLGHDICAGQPSSGADADVFEVSFWFKAVSPDVNTQLVQVVPGNTAGTDRASNAFHLNNIPGTGVSRTDVENRNCGTGIIFQGQFQNVTVAPHSGARAHYHYRPHSEARPVAILRDSQISVYN